MQPLSGETENRCPDRAAVYGGNREIYFAGYSHGRTGGNARNIQTGRIAGNTANIQPCRSGFATADGTGMFTAQTGSQAERYADAVAVAGRKAAGQTGSQAGGADGRKPYCH